MPDLKEKQCSKVADLQGLAQITKAGHDTTDNEFLYSPNIRLVLFSPYVLNKNSLGQKFLVLPSNYS